MRVVLEGQLRERRPLHVQNSDGIERDVDTARLCRHGIKVLVDGLFVKGVNMRCFGDSSCGGNLLRDCVELGKSAAREKDPRAFASKDTRHRAADRSASSIIFSSNNLPF
jgi:hypothetical protein